MAEHGEELGLRPVRRLGLGQQPLPLIGMPPTSVMSLETASSRIGLPWPSLMGVTITSHHLGWPVPVGQ